MSTQENIKLSGQIHAVLYDADGNVKNDVDVSNLVVTTGKQFFASKLVGGSVAGISHIAVGAGTTAPDVTQTALVTETARVAISSGTATGAVITYVATFGPGVGTGAINECGMFNASTGGTLFARSTNVVLTKGAADTLALTWTITLN